MSCLLINILDKTNRLKVSVSKVKKENVSTTITRITPSFSVEVIHKKIEISSTINRVGESLSVSTEYSGIKLNVGCSVLCSIRIAEDGYELFEANDGMFILYGDDYYKVLKEDGV